MDGVAAMNNCPICNAPDHIEALGLRERWPEIEWHVGHNIGDDSFGGVMGFDDERFVDANVNGEWCTIFWNDDARDPVEGKADSLIEGLVAALESLRLPVVVSYGGGIDGTALLIEMKRRGIRPDVILFADTGNRAAGKLAEKPETYAHVDRMNQWCLDAWGVGITTVRNDGMYETLENNCLQKNMLPSVAYGFKSCSDKYKIRPQNKYVKQWALDNRIEGDIYRVLGYNADEAHRRSEIKQDGRYIYRYFLIEWGIGREECKRIVMSELGYLPVKSACYFCPSSKKSEVIWLSQAHPALFARAVAMEENAQGNLDSVVGLGRRWRWSDLVAADANQFKLFPEPPAIPCACFDGDDDD
jgi:hypothetical protein